MVVEKNKVVSIFYEIRDIQRRLLDSNKGFAPLEYLQGAGNLIPGLEIGLEGIHQGECREFKIAAADAFGAYDASLLLKIENNQPENPGLSPGDYFRLADGRIGIIKEINQDYLQVDLNHPLAGMDLWYQVEIIHIREAADAELEIGRPLDTGEFCSGEAGCC